MSSSLETPWHAAFPPPTITAPIFPRSRAQMVLAMKIASLLIVDVRRTDYEGGAIRGSRNIPAQGFYWNRGILYELAYKADIEWVVFTCGSCKENSRGARCASWFLEHVRNTVGDEDMQVMVLEGGMKGWVKAGPEYTQFMDGFDEGYWQKELGDPEIKKPEFKEPAVEKTDAEKVLEAEGKLETGAGASKDKDTADAAPAEKKWSWEAMME